MFVYRIAHSKYKQYTLSGIGSEKVGGRWNEVGTRAVYCSENISLALLEYFIHSDRVSSLPKEILVAKIHIPENFPILSLKGLPKEWNQYPYTSKTTRIFSEKVKDPGFFALEVPSSIVGLEFNYVLNPLYPKFGQVQIDRFFKVPVDPRLSKQK